MIEVWLENASMVEILPPEFAAEYLAFTLPDKVAAAMGSPDNIPTPSDIASQAVIARYFPVALFSVVIPLVWRLQFVVRRKNSIDPPSNEFAA